MTFLNTTITRSLITLSLLSGVFVSCETEESDVLNNEETISEVNDDITEEEFWETVAVGQIDFDEENTPLDELVEIELDEEILSSISEENLLQNLEEGNLRFLITPEDDMKNWEAFRVATDVLVDGVTERRITILEQWQWEWIGSKAWGDDNRATLWVVPYSGNNDTYYWGRAKTYYPWFNSVDGTNVLYVGADSYDPNGE